MNFPQEHYITLNYDYEWPGRQANPTDQYSVINNHTIIILNLPTFSNKHYA